MDPCRRGGGGSPIPDVRLLAIPYSVNKRLAGPRERRGILWSCSPSKWENSRFVLLLSTLTFILPYNCSNNLHFYLVNWNIPSGSNFLCWDLKIQHCSLLLRKNVTEVFLYVWLCIEFEVIFARNKHYKCDNDPNWLSFDRAMQLMCPLLIFETL